MGQPVFFDLNERYQSLSKCGDPLEVLDREISWENFRPALKKAFKKTRKSNAGRKSFDPVLMFKVIVLQSLYNLSDAQMEFRSVTVFPSCVFWAWDGRYGAGRENHLAV